MNTKTHPKLNLIGHVYGNLTVVGEAPSFRGRTHWMCLCRCGNQSAKATSDLRRKGRRVAGCSIKCPLVGSIISESGKTHGMSRHKGFYAYNNMRARCLRPSSHKWKDYGGRGISICKRWQESFENFWEDMGPTYVEGLTLHRKNNNGNYHKRNCCWATHKTQALNRRNNVRPKGAPSDFREKASEKGVKVATFYRRIKMGRNWKQVVSDPYEFRISKRKK